MLFVIMACCAANINVSKNRRDYVIVIEVSVVLPSAYVIECVNLTDDME